MLSLSDQVGSHPWGGGGNSFRAAQHLLLISQSNSMSSLQCTSSICMNTNKNFIPLHNESKYMKLPSFPVIVYLSFADSGQVVGGSESLPHSWPWQVSLRNSSNIPKKKYLA